MCLIRGYRTDPRIDTSVCGSGDKLSQFECFPWLTFSWARFRDFWTRLAMKPAPAWRFGPILFSAIVTFFPLFWLLRTKLSPAPVRGLLKLPSSLWRLQYKAMEVEQQRKCRDTLTTDSWGFRHTVVHDGGLFKLVLNLCRNGGDVSEACKPAVHHRFEEEWREIQRRSPGKDVHGLRNMVMR